MERGGKFYRTRRDRTLGGVAGGLGIGLSVAVPDKKLPVNVRALTLQKFPTARLGMMWQGKKLPLVDNFLDMARQRAKALK